MQIPRRRGPAPRTTRPTVEQPHPHEQLDQNAPSDLQEELFDRARRLPGVTVSDSLVSVPGVPIPDTDDLNSAPVRATGSIQIAATPEHVWSTLTDFATWPEWMPGVAAMTAPDPLMPGSVFVWKASGATIRSEIVELVRPHLILWRGQMLGIRATHLWHIQRSDNDTTTVDTAEGWHGLLVRLLRPVMQRALDRAIDDGLGALKERAERRPG